MLLTQRRGSSGGGGSTDDQLYAIAGDILGKVRCVTDPGSRVRRGRGQYRRSAERHRWRHSRKGTLCY